MTIFGLATLQGSATWLELARNLAWTVPGNIIGGGLLVGVTYSWLNGARPRTAPTGADDDAGDQPAATAGGEGGAVDAEPETAPEPATAPEPEPVTLPAHAIERAAR